MNKKRVYIIASIVIFLALILSLSMFFGLKKFQSIDKADTNVTTNSVANTKNEESNTGNATPSLTISKPVNNQNISLNRAISGQMKNIDGIVYYQVSGIDAGLLAEGKVVSDNDGTFSFDFSYIKKPIDGDSGNLDFYTINTQQQKTTLQSIKVSF